MHKKKQFWPHPWDTCGTCYPFPFVIVPKSTPKICFVVSKITWPPSFGCRWAKQISFHWSSCCIKPRSNFGTRPSYIATKSPYMSSPQWEVDRQNTAATPTLGSVETTHVIIPQKCPHSDVSALKCHTVTVSFELQPYSSAIIIKQIKYNGASKIYNCGRC